MNTVMDVLYDLVETLAYGFLCLVEVAVFALIFWGFWCVVVWAVNTHVGGG